MLLQQLVVVQEHRPFLAQPVHGIHVLRYLRLQIPRLLFNGRSGCAFVSQRDLSETQFAYLEAPLPTYGYPALPNQGSTLHRPYPVTRGGEPRNFSIGRTKRDTPIQCDAV